nr:2-oxoglutarate and iron-dependent oxygenase domain-containing protein [Streptomyces sp. PKU-EA00015]
MAIPTIELRPWFAEDPVARTEIARTVDRALQSAGFLLVTGHGMDDALRRRIRSVARQVFGLPADV